MTETHPSSPKTGVVATLHLVAKGRFRLVMDDVKSVPTLDATSWKREGHFTNRDFAISSPGDLDLTKEQLAEIGENWLMRLMAARGNVLPDGSYRATRQCVGSVRESI